MNRIVPTDLSNAQTICEVLSLRAAIHPERIAYTFIGSEERPNTTLSFSEVYNLSQAAAVQIRRQILAQDGMKGREKTALLMYSPGLEFIAGFFGCLYAGVIAVPIYPPKSNRHIARLRGVATDSGAYIGLASSADLDKVERFFATDDRLRHIRVLATDALPLSVPCSNLANYPKPDSLAMLQYTSGTTNDPKGVILTHANIMANERAICEAGGHDESMIMCSWLPIFHDMGLFGGLLSSLFVGGQTIFMSPSAFLHKPERWLEAATRTAATDIVAPNFAYALTLSSRNGVKLDLSSIRVAWNGAEPIRADVLDSFDSVFDDCGWCREMHLPCYGLAEATLMVTAHRHGTKPRILTINTRELEQGRAVPIEDSRETPVTRVVSCGVPYGETRIAIVNAATGRSMPERAIGEIWIKGPGVAQGYWNKPEETEQVFRARIESDNDVWMRSGDLGFVSEGELFVTGRLKDMVIIRGRNLYPQDVEKAVENALQTVGPNTVAAFAITGGGIERLALVIEATRRMVRDAAGDGVANAKPDRAMGKIRNAVIDEFDVAPEIIVFVRPGTFPRTSSGKVQRSLCRTHMCQDKLEIVRATGLEILDGPLALTLSTHTTGSNQITEAVRAAVVAWLAEHAPGELPRWNDVVDFATLGIDSIGGARIAAAISKKTRLAVTPDMVYANQSVVALAAYLKSYGVKESSVTDESHGPPFAPTASDPYARYRELNQRATKWRAEGRYFFAPEITEQSNAWIQADGRRMMMLGSYGYLGLLKHPQLKEAALEVINAYGTGHHGTPLLAGTTALHRQLEWQLANLMCAAESIIFSSGYVTNVATITALVGRGDAVIGDQWNHASIVDGCRFSGAEFHEFRHNDMADLRAKLEASRGRHTLVLVDAVYSMEGDIANLPEIVPLCREFNALLMVDEAHSLGVLGQTGKGVQEHFGLPDDAIDVKMGTLSKALSSSGGFVAGRHDLIFYIRHHARGYIFSGALPVAEVAAASTALDVLDVEPERVVRLWQNRARFATGLKNAGFRTFGSETPIVPIATQSEDQTLEMTRLCRDNGLFVVPVFYPAVPMNAPRLRTCVMASHTDDDIDFALNILTRAGRSIGIIK